MNKDETDHNGKQTTVWTIGHSTRSIDEFLDLLATHEIELLVDIRRFPGSRKYPHFNKEPLGESLGRAGITYIELPELGGRRRPRPDSRNTVWRSESFRGYADYMETDEFAAGLDRLLSEAGRRRTSIMCSEAVWWRCHRALVSDKLKSIGVIVRHIQSTRSPDLHPYTSAARILNGVLTYTPEEGAPSR